MEAHFNGNNSRGTKNQEMGTFRRKFSGRNLKFNRNGECSKTLNYWGKIRKSAVRTNPSILRPNYKDHEVVACDGNKGFRCFQKGIHFFTPKATIGGAHQVFEKMPQRVKNDIFNVNFPHVSGGGGGEVRTVPKMGVINIGKERQKLLKRFREKCEFFRRKNVVPRRVDLLAYNVLRESGELFLTEKKLGPIAGVEIEDCFEFRFELMIMGLHDHPLRGIEYMETSSGRVLATSIVTTEGYGDNVNADEVVYTGEGGGNFHPNQSKKITDQELRGGNLALKNSIIEGNYVRVVRGVKSRGNNMKSNNTIFVYDGLYNVVDYGMKMGVNGKMQFEFKLKRCSGQKNIKWAKYK